MNEKWNVETLLELMNERDRRYTEKFEAQEKAVTVAEANTAKWQANANEWRKTMDDRERNFLPKSMGYVIGALTIFTMLISISGKFLGD